MRSQPIHALPRRRIDFGRLAQHQRQNLMARSHLGQVHVGFKADLLEFGNPLVRELILQILGHRVGIRRQTTAEQCRHAEPQATHAIARAMHQGRGEFALFDLLADVLRVVRLEVTIQVGQHRSQRESHTIPNGFRLDEFPTKQQAWTWRPYACLRMDTSRTQLVGTEAQRRTTR